MFTTTQILENMKSRVKELNVCSGDKQALLQTLEILESHVQKLENETIKAIQALEETLDSLHTNGL